MALQTVKFQSKKYIPTYACEEVAVCLTDVWADRVTSGVAIAFAEVQNSGRPLGPRGDRVPPPWENPRGQELFQYELVFDDSQFETDPETDEPYVITCEDIVDFTGACFWHKFVDYVESQT